jgi:hypothetical protein
MADSNPVGAVASPPPRTVTDDLLQGFTPGAGSYFEKTVAEYGDKLASESRSIERMEHAGGGPAEITAAHVEEAKWVLVRRLRRGARQSNLLVVVRIAQTLTAVAVGIGAANFAQAWGGVMCVVGVLIGSLSVVIEREMTREL